MENRDSPWANSPSDETRRSPGWQERNLADQIPSFIGQSEAIETVLELVHLVAQSATTPVLIMGETGTGKELIARAIHYRSTNSEGPLVSVNCAAIPSELIESELFGYTRGAFTGANTAGKRGLIEAAANGTLFLDEIGDLSLSAQAKLLRFLENGEFYQVGGTHIVHVQTRVVSATNRDLEAFIAQGRFRADLYYRLSVVQLKVPSLNERREDILPLAHHFLTDFSRSFGRSLQGMTPEAEHALLSHRWHGNIRELKNCMERAVLVSRGPTVTKRDLWLYETEPQGPARSCTELPPDGLDLVQRLEEIERAFLSLALQQARGNESQAARLLQLNHHTFRYRLRRMGLKQ